MTRLERLRHAATLHRGLIVFAATVPSRERWPGFGRLSGRVAKSLRLARAEARMSASDRIGFPQRMVLSERRLPEAFGQSKPTDPQQLKRRTP